MNYKNEKKYGLLAIEMIKHFFFEALEINISKYLDRENIKNDFSFIYKNSSISIFDIILYFHQRLN